MLPTGDRQTCVFYDGACPVCNAEMNALRRWDQAGQLNLIDIAAPEYDERAWPVSITAMNALLHVRLPDGRWQTGMAATRHVYRVIGRGWMVAFTGWPLLSPLFDRAYAWFARNRLPISSRLGLFLGARRCTDGVCRMPHP
jgi:predicted DCC family thiol-disulfide oxidoreductase YuxK